MKLLLLIAGAALTFIALGRTAHAQDPAKATNLGAPNTKANEDDPFYYVLGRSHVVLFTSNASGTFDVMGTQLASGKWGKGQAIRSLNTDKFDERSPILSSNRNVFFVSNEIPDEKFKDLQNFDLFQRSGMTAAFRLNGIGVNEREDETDVWITATGREFYFSRKTKAGLKMFVANGPKPGPIGSAKEVGFPVGYHHATITKSGTTMYLEGPDKSGRSKLFRSRRSRVGAKWSKPAPIVNLLDPKSKIGDASPCVTPDGKRLFFASDRPGGEGGLDLWIVSVKALEFGK